MRIRDAYLIILSTTLPASIFAATNEQANACSRWTKGTTQTSAGVCIDGVLFKDVLARLSALEAISPSPSVPQGKQGD